VPLSPQAPTLNLPSSERLDDDEGGALRALVYEGPMRMTLRQVDDPQPEAGEILVAVRASGICGSDVHGFAGTTGRRQPPLIMGHEVAGTVAAVGPDIESVAPGDRVVLRSILPCGDCAACRAGRTNVCLRRRSLGIHIPGGYADSVKVPAVMAERLPDAIDWELGPMIEPLAVAMHAVNMTPFEMMDSVVIIGAGTIGLLSLLVARRRGAGTLIVIDLNERRLALARDLGADLALSGADGDVVDAVRAASSGEGAHAVLEAVGLSTTARQSVAMARNGGQVTWVGNLEPKVEIDMQELVARELTVQGAYGSSEEFPLAIAALESMGAEVRRLIERTAPLDDGPRLFGELATGELDAVKVVLTPRA
jgi:L-iditol 2-dehydrogenase